MAAAWRGNVAEIVWMMLLLCSPQLGLNVVAQSCSQSSLCANNLCCSRYNYCGSTSDYCGDGCLSGPCTGSGSTPAPSGSGVGSIITEAVYNQFFLHTSDCSTNNFYTYSAFITAASSYGAFGNTGDDTTRRQELAAFFAQVSHETTGGWPTAPDGQYAWGLCFITENGCPDVYCSNSATYPCAPGKNYCGRGPIQISWNYNYGQAGDALGQDLLNNPDLVATDGVVSWKTALWFWNTAQSPKPSAHSVMVGEWSPSSDDQAANRLPGFGVTTNIINGGLECGPNGNHDREQDRIGFYERYCSILGVSPGNNVDCSNQTPWS